MCLPSTYCTRSSCESSSRVLTRFLDNPWQQKCAKGVTKWNRKTQKNEMQSKRVIRQETENIRTRLGLMFYCRNHPKRVVYWGFWLTWLRFIHKLMSGLEKSSHLLTLRVLRLLLCPNWWCHLGYVFALGGIRVGLVFLGAGTVLGRARGLRHLPGLLVWKELFNYVKEASQRAAWVHTGKRRTREGERENKQMNNMDHKENTMRMWRQDQWEM